jgi:hypothetical protein
MLFVPHFLSKSTGSADLAVDVDAVTGTCAVLL